MVFADMSFQLANGEALIVRGPNGVGKSSLLRILAGLLRPAAGSVDLCGVALAEDAVAYRRNLAWLGHLDALKALETVAQSVRFAAALHGGHDIAPALMAMGLEPLADTRIRFLSAGQKRRVALAGLIASGAKLWLADEPTTGLDAEYTGRFHAALTDHLAAGGMAVISTHEAFPLAKHCSELVMGAA
jgi:heme exporter protein A